MHEKGLRWGLHLPTRRHLQAAARWARQCALQHASLQYYAVTQPPQQQRAHVAPQPVLCTCEVYTRWRKGDVASGVIATGLELELPNVGHLAQRGNVPQSLSRAGTFQ